MADHPESGEGDYFRAQIEQVAIPNLDARAANMVLVTSFNEWFEDTQIEATTGRAVDTGKDNSPSGDFYTHGEIYRDYGFLYLDILRELTMKGD